MAEWLFNLIDQLIAIDLATWIRIITVTLLVILLLFLIRMMFRIVLRSWVCAEFGLNQIPSRVRIRPGLFPKEGKLVLAFPTWRYPKQDGTADRRRSNNGLIAVRSRLVLGRYRMKSKDPFSIYNVALQARQSGYHIAWTSEERRKEYKRSAVTNHTRVLRDNVTASEIVAAYAERPTDFEEFCAELLRALGYRVNVTPRSRDGGYDLEMDYDGVRYIAECKCFATTAAVGRPHLQKLVGANATAEAQGLMFLTTASYSRDAKEFAQVSGIKLVDGSQLASLTRQVSGKIQTTHLVEGAALTNDELWQYYPADVRPSVRT